MNLKSGDFITLQIGDDEPAAAIVAAVLTDERPALLVIRNQGAILLAQDSTGQWHAYSAIGRPVTISQSKGATR